MKPPLLGAAEARTAGEKTVRSLFSDESFVDAFRRGRKIPASRRHQYSALLGQLYNGHGAVLDIGCGPSPLSLLLPKERLQENEVWLLDQSQPMLASATTRAALRTPHARTVTCHRSWRRMGRLDQRFQLIILSDVCHLIDDERVLADMLLEALVPGGRVLIRHVHVDRVRTHSWYAGFPQALAIDQYRATRGGRLIRHLRTSGLRLVEHRVLDESRFYEPVQWSDRLATRCYSTLRLLSKREVSYGLAVQRRLHRSRFRCVDDRDVVVLEKSLR